MYSAWANGGVGGQSESIIGSWMTNRGVRGEILIATKVGQEAGLDDIRSRSLHAGVDASLTRLRTDYIDLYYAHQDDGGDLHETMGAFDGLVRGGKIRAVGLSNFSPDRIRAAIEVCEREGYEKPVALQPQYSIMERDFEQTTQEVVAEAGLAVVPYSALAGGFLTGKYRPGGPDVDSPRADGAREYLRQPRGVAVLAALDSAADAHGVPVASVALAWLRAQPTVVSPIASARTVEQIKPLALAMHLILDREELEAIDRAAR